jgi:hypothetical protein
VRAARIEVEIGELALHGFGSIDGERVARLVERELGRLFAERGLPQSLVQSGDRPAVPRSSFRLGAAREPAAVAAGVARALYGAAPR